MNTIQFSPAVISDEAVLEIDGRCRIIKRDFAMCESLVEVTIPTVPVEKNNEPWLVRSDS